MRVASPSERGTSLVEVLVTMVVVAVGLLGLAAFQSKAQVGNIESFQRAQAAVLLQDMQSRIENNIGNAAAYVTDSPLGTGDTLKEDCSTYTAGAERDRCEWSQALKGAAEASGTTKVGAMIGARGCVAQVQVENRAPGVCQPAVYLVSVSWQGMHPTKAPAQACGKDSTPGADDTYRRVVSARVSAALLDCK
jgi:type IV pilus assembly protein PilV